MDVHDFLPPDPTLVQRYNEYQETSPSIWFGYVIRHKLKAVILDCEMAEIQTPEGSKKMELILLCVADFLTGEPLLNELVRPFGNVSDWRTRHTGATATDIDEAVKKGTALNGWRAARSKLWELIDSDAILIGHSLKNDLDILRIIHTKIVDSAILTSNAMGVHKGSQLPLQDLCKQLLGMTIQDHGKQGHSCLEDVMATREVVIWCIKNPEALAEWGRVSGEPERQKKHEVRKARQPGEMELLFLEGIEKNDKRQRAEEEASIWTLSDNRATVHVKRPLPKSMGLVGPGSDNRGTKRESRLEENGSRDPKRLKPSRKASDTDESWFGARGEEGLDL
jgi:DNA polymerase III epsilon subunit-like protein